MLDEQWGRLGLRYLWQLLAAHTFPQLLVPEKVSAFVQYITETPQSGVKKPANGSGLLKQPRLHTVVVHHLLPTRVVRRSESPDGSRRGSCEGGDIHIAHLSGDSSRACTSIQPDVSWCTWEGKLLVDPQDGRFCLGRRWLWDGLGGHHSQQPPSTLSALQQKGNPGCAWEE